MLSPRQSLAYPEFYLTLGGEGMLIKITSVL